MLAACASLTLFGSCTVAPLASRADDASVAHEPPVAPVNDPLDTALDVDAPPAHNRPTMAAPASRLVLIHSRFPRCEPSSTRLWRQPYGRFESTYAERATRGRR